MLESRKRTDEEIEKYMEELRAWLLSQREVPAEEMAGFFAARLDGYEDVHRQNWGEVYDHIADYFDEGLASLLDVGCGTGLELHALFKRFPQLQVTGVDLSADMLGKLRENHKEKQRQITLLQGDYFQVPLGEEAFDAAMSFETLHHFKYEKKLGLYQRLFKALRRGGYYVECDYVACCEEEERITQEQMDYRRQKSGLPDDQFIHIDTPLTLPHQMELLEKAGFQQVRVLYENGGTVILRGERPQ